MARGGAVCPVKGMAGQGRPRHALDEDNDDVAGEYEYNRLAVHYE